MSADALSSHLLAHGEAAHVRSPRRLRTLSFAFAMPRAQLQRIRWAVRMTLILGVAASVTANVLHARENPISQAIAAWPPLALLLTVELISRVPVHRRSLAFARLVATAAIAGIAAWVSYWHMAGVAARYGETGASPYLLPLSVDGLIVVASICLVELSGRIAADQAAAAPQSPPAPPAPRGRKPALPPRTDAPPPERTSTGGTVTAIAAGRKRRQTRAGKDDPLRELCRERVRNGEECKVVGPALGRSKRWAEKHTEDIRAARTVITPGREIPRTPSPPIPAPHL